MSSNQPPPTPTPSPARPRSRRRLFFKVFGATVTVFLLAIVVSSLLAFRAATRPPEWWQPVNPADPQVDTAARSIENSVTSKLHEVRPPSASPKESDEWTITLRGDEANAWLAARLKEWMANRSEKMSWPANASSPQVRFEEGKILLGVEVSGDSVTRVVSVGLAPAVDANGALWLKLQTLGIGRFNVPGSTVVDAGGSLLEDKLPPELKNNPDTAEFVAALAGRKPLTDHATMKLSDGRKVQILRIMPHEGTLEVTCKTVYR